MGAKEQKRKGFPQQKNQIPGIAKAHDRAKAKPGNWGKGAPKTRAVVLDRTSREREEERTGERERS